MDCSLPPPLTDDQLSTALDDQAEPEVLTHLAVCAACTLRLDTARQAEGRLHASLYRWDCPPAQQLADYHIGRLTGEQERAIVRHLATCARCIEEIDDLRRFLLTDESQAAKGTAVPTPSKPAGRRPLIGQLLPATAPALRGGGGGPIQAQAGDTTIFLDVQPAGVGQVVLQGQMIDEEQERWVGGLVELRQGGALRATAEVDELGAFSCGPFPPGSSELRITSPGGRALVVPNLVLEAASA
jgi:hypothetical protein